MESKIARIGCSKSSSRIARYERDYVGVAQTICLNAFAVRAKSRGEMAAQLRRRGVAIGAAQGEFVTEL